MIVHTQLMAGYLSTADLAELLGMKPASLRFLRAQSRPGGRYANDPFPEPDLIIARSPAWSGERADEIKAWNKRRPGQGAGGGRPRKTES